MNFYTDIILQNYMSIYSTLLYFTLLYSVPIYGLVSISALEI